MDVVLLLVAVAGIALIAVPRLQARRAGAGRASAARRRRATRTRARKAVRMTAASSPVATWTPGPATAPTSSEDEVWDDDLGWEGDDESPGGRDEEPVAPARAEWDRRRATQSPLAPVGEDNGASAELPSVERWRERAARPPQDDEWLEDDDGLGWEGSAATAPVWNGNGNGDGSPEGLASLAVSPRGRDFRSGRDETRDSEEPAITASATAAEPHAAGHVWTAAAAAAAPAPAAPRRRRSLRGIHPVLLVALYAAVGIGLVVLGSTALLDDSSPKPATDATRKPAAQPAAATVEAGSATAPPDTSKADQRKAAAAFRAGRTAARRAEARAVATARAAARKHARALAAARAKARARKGAATPAAPATNGAGSTYSPPARSYTPPTHQGRGGGGGGSVCEFCIG